MSLYIAAGFSLAAGIGLLAAGLLDRRRPSEDAAEVTRLTAPYAPEREDLTDEYKGQHRLGIAHGAQAQRALWDCPTGQFWTLRNGFYYESPELETTT